MTTPNSTRYGDRSSSVCTLLNTSGIVCERQDRWVNPLDETPFGDDGICYPTESRLSEPVFSEWLETKQTCTSCIWSRGEPRVRRCLRLSNVRES